ncbi:MAG: hypothetical protein AAGA20_23275 [Planctomycetota bacterium]
MRAFRFLALLTVGFVLLVLVFLLNASNARLEREATRELRGPTFEAALGGGATWTIDLGERRVEQAWPSEQRQPRLYLRGAGGATIAAVAEYLGEGDEAQLPAFVGEERIVGAPGEESGELEFGPLWMSWEHPLRITFEVVGAEGDPAEATPILRGEPSLDFVAARAIARTLWAVFTILGLVGFAGLVATQDDLFKPRGSEG